MATTNHLVLLSEPTVLVGMHPLYVGSQGCYWNGLADQCACTGLRQGAERNETVLKHSTVYMVFGCH